MDWFPLIIILFWAGSCFIVGFAAEKDGRRHECDKLRAMKTLEEVQAYLERRQKASS